MEQATRFAEPKSALWVFGNIGGRCIVQGLALGALYGMLCGTIYSAYSDGGRGTLSFLNNACFGIAFGLGIGLCEGAFLGLMGAVVLGTFTAIWHWRQNTGTTQRSQAHRNFFRPTFTLICVSMTMIVSILIFLENIYQRNPVTGIYVYPTLVKTHLYFGSLDAFCAGLAAFQASRKVLSWYQKTMGFGGGTDSGHTVGPRLDPQGEV